MQIRYVDGPRLRRSLLAATEHARDTRAEPTRINPESAGSAFGRKRVLSAMMRWLEEVVRAGVREVRSGVVHVGCEGVVERGVQALGERWPDAEFLSGTATPVIATPHVDIDAWALGYMVEDGVLEGRVE